jgi:chorismate dehydratase
VTPIRLGAVNYLNARPLVYGLELRSQLFSVRFDTPSKCAALLHEGSIDVGMIPSIEYLRGRGYKIAPGMGIVSEGPVASVAVFSSRSIDQVRSVALDTSSRTSNALFQVLCYELFGVDPQFIPMPPDPEAMLTRCDAALMIGDPALFFDHAAAGVLKVDLGERWTTMTGLPFVWAFWAGRAGVLTGEAIDVLTEARDAGVRESDALAAAYCGPERTARAQAYLRDNIRYTLGPREEVGLMRYYELAAKHGLVEDTRALEYF